MQRGADSAPPSDLSRGWRYRDKNRYTNGGTNDEHIPKKFFELGGHPAPLGPHLGPKWPKIMCFGKISADSGRGAPGPPFFVKGVTDTYKKYSAAETPSGHPEEPGAIGPKSIYFSKKLLYWKGVVAWKPKIVKTQYFCPIFFSKGSPRRAYRNCLLKTFWRRPGPAGAPFWGIFSKNLKSFFKFSIFGPPGAAPEAPSAKLYMGICQKWSYSSDI